MGGKLEPVGWLSSYVLLSKGSGRCVQSFQTLLGNVTTPLGWEHHCMFLMYTLNMHILFNFLQILYLIYQKHMGIPVLYSIKVHMIFNSKSSMVTVFRYVSKQWLQRNNENLPAFVSWCLFLKSDGLKYVMRFYFSQASYSVWEEEEARETHFVVLNATL